MHSAQAPAAVRTDVATPVAETAKRQHVSNQPSATAPRGLPERPDSAAPKVQSPSKSNRGAESEEGQEKVAEEEKHTDETDSVEEDAHAVLCSYAERERSTCSELRSRSLSRHVLPNSVSFSSIDRLHEAVLGLVHKQIPCMDYITASGSQLVFSAQIGKQPSCKTSRKRGRTDEYDAQIEASVSKLRKVGNTIQVEIDAAQTLLKRCLAELKGPSGETLIQSYGIFARPLGASHTGSLRILVGLLLHSGVGVSLSCLKHCLGSCWMDGMVTLDDSACGVRGVDLPVSPEGNVSNSMGNKPMLIVTSIPRMVS